ncbi:MAG: DUF3261 domain-containing protein [Cellvibrionaceae bacterium]
MPYSVKHRTQFYVVFFTGLLSLLLTACSNLFVPKEMPELPLLPPHEFGKNIQISQRVSIISDESSNTLLAAWVVSEEAVSVVGLSPTGQRLLTLEYDGEFFKEEYSELLDQEIPGRAVMSYMQLAHWPEQSILDAFVDSDWAINFLSNQRVLYYKNRHVLDINIKEEITQSFEGVGKKINIISYVMPIVLDVETLSVISSEVH